MNLKIKLLSLSAVLLLTSCAALSMKQQKYVKESDLVCGMKVEVSEAYTLNYKGNKYYFDNYDCKQIFKMNPEKFINNICVPPSDSTIHK